MGPVAKIRVFVVDDHPVFLGGLKALIGANKDMEFVGSLGTAEGLVKVGQEIKPDIVLMDIEMPGPDPFEEMENIRSECPNVRVIVLSAYVRDFFIDAAVNTGAWGYLYKGDDPKSIITAIREVHKGGFVFGSSINDRLAMRQKPGNDQNNRLCSKIRTLTSRELQVLRLIGMGLSRAEISKALNRSPKTVDGHRKAIMEKVDIHDRTGLALYAIREGLAEP